jgi:acyl-CoA synthetase (NDP forming)
MDKSNNSQGRVKTDSWQKALFEPRSIALVGASKDPKKWGFNLLFNVIKGGYPGRIYPVNPREREILGFKVYRSIGQIPEPVDLAILVVPPSDILSVIQECGKNGAKVGVIITAGFGEVNLRGKNLEEEMVTRARSLGMRLMGPNCQGVVSIGKSPLYAHMPPQFPRSGPVGVVSQSGNLATSLIEIGSAMGLGFSRVISSGNEADLQTPDFLEALAEDSQTEVILSYLEGVKEGRKFFQTVRKVSSKKPLLIVKGGQTEAGVKAAFSHTGALCGTDHLFNSLFRQTGVIRAEAIEEMLDMAAALTTQPLPKGRRLGIITLGGGWGVLAADYCARAGLIIEELPGKAIKALDEVLPPWWNRMNPVDMVAGYRKGDLVRSMELLLSSKKFDGVILLGLGWRAVRGGFLKTWAITPEDGMEAAGQDWIEEEEKVFTDLQDLGRKYGKPILLASDVIQHTPGVEKGIRSRRVAAYPSLARAVRAYLGLVKRYETLKPKSGPKEESLH